MRVSGSFLLITGPNADLVALVALANDGAAYFIAVLAELLADHGQQQLEPTNVQVLSYGDKPSTAAFVRFPSWLGPLAKYIIVARLRESRRWADIVEQCPECFDAVEGGDATEAGLPGFVAAVIIEVPEYPSVFERMTDPQEGR